jgi:hypothetical protein
MTMFGAENILTRLRWRSASGWYWIDLQDKVVRIGEAYEFYKIIRGAHNSMYLPPGADAKLFDARPGFHRFMIEWNGGPSTLQQIRDRHR